MMGKSERKANDGEEQETNMRMMGKSEKRQMMGTSKRQANDGEEQETDMRMMGKSERQTCE